MSRDEILLTVPVPVREGIENIVAASEADASSELELRPYQVDAWVRLHQSRLDGARRGLIHMATGLGKTTVVAGDIAVFAREQAAVGRAHTSVLFLAHQHELLAQARERFEQLLPGFTTVTPGEKQETPGDTIMYATLQTMRRRRKQYDRGFFDYVVVDESHHGAADSYQGTIRYFQPRFLLGVTATPFRGDSRSLATLFGPVLYTKGLARAFAEEWLVMPDYRLQMDDALEQVIGRKFASLKAANRALFSPLRAEEAASIITATEAELVRPRAIVFCRTIAHAEQMAALLPNARLLHSHLSPEQRRQVISDFRLPPHDHHRGYVQRGCGYPGSEPAGLPADHLQPHDF